MLYLEFILPLLVILIIGGILFFNWQLSQKRGVSAPNKGGFISPTALDARIATLEQDVDQLSVIVRDMSQLLAQHEERFNENDISTPIIDTNLQNVSLYLRPIKHLETNALFAYETFVELKDEKIYAQDALTLWRLENTLIILSKLTSAAPVLKLLCALPASLLVRDNVMKPLMLSMRQNATLLPNLVLLITGKDSIVFNSIEQFNLKKLADMQVAFGLELKVVDSKIISVEKIETLKTMNFNLISTDARQLLYANLNAESIEKLEADNLSFIASDIDDLVDEALLMNKHIRYGSGARLGAARPVKTQAVQESEEERKIA
jgi:hypothetical protein